MPTSKGRCVAALPLLLLLLSCAPAGRGTGLDIDRRSASVQLILDEADAALSLIEAGATATEEQWTRLWLSEGYRRLEQREAAMGRAFDDIEFRTFLLRDSLRAHAPALRAAVERWRGADVRAAAARAYAYLPADAVIRARLYPVIKPRTNSFVFELDTDSAAIFMFIDPSVPRGKLENTLAHELHHVGLAASCPDWPAFGPEPAEQVRRWIGAFGEGLAMLAAAGGPEAHPHEASTSEERARWDRDYANAPADLERIERFFTAVLDGRIEGEEVTGQAMSFFGDAQGPWYTVGYMMAVDSRAGSGKGRAADNRVQSGGAPRRVECRGRAAQRRRRPAALVGGPVAADPNHDTKPPDVTGARAGLRGPADCRRDTGAAALR